MSRSKWKTPFIDRNLFKILNSTKIPSTWSRRSTVYPAAVGLQIKIHNGKDMVKRKIKPEMVGHKLGEFVQTRKKAASKRKIISPKQNK